MRLDKHQIYAYLLDVYGDNMQVSRAELLEACHKTIGHGVGYYSQVSDRMPMLMADDLIQAGVIGLLLAVRFYDPKKGGFWEYAQYIVRKEVFRHIRQASPILPRARWHSDYPTQVIGRL